MRAIHIVALIVLGAVWGASFLFIRTAAHDFGPLLLMFLRVLLAGLALIPVAYLMLKNRTSEKPIRILSHWREFLIMGALNAALPFTLIGFAELSITASLASILNALTPLCTAIVASIWIGEKLTQQKMLGGILGIIGVAILVGGSPVELSPSFLIAVCASIGAAICYGLGNVYASQHIKGIPVIQASIGQLFGATIILAIPASATIPDTPPSTTAIFALISLILMSTSFAFLIYFYLLSNIGPTRTASVTFLVPIFGTVWGIIFLKEAFSIGMLLGMVIILLSVGLVLGINFRPSQALSTD